MALRVLGTLTLSLAHWHRRLSTLLYSKLVSGAFSRFGAGSRLALPVHIVGADRISLGSGIYVGPGSSLHALTPEARIVLGDGVRITGGCFISAVRQVTIGNKVLLAKNVHIADHMHKYSQTGVAVMDQGVDKVAPVIIEDGAWIAQGVVICPGVTIGRGAVIGANSIVNSNIESYCVAAGSPARIVKRFAAPATA